MKYFSIVSLMTVVHALRMEAQSTVESLPASQTTNEGDYDGDMSSEDNSRIQALPARRELVEPENPAEMGGHRPAIVIEHEPSGDAIQMAGPPGRKEVVLATTPLHQDDVCAICHEPLSENAYETKGIFGSREPNIARLECGHEYHMNPCLNKWWAACDLQIQRGVRTTRTCALCNHPAPTPEITDAQPRVSVAPPRVRCYYFVLRGLRCDNCSCSRIAAHGCFISVIFIMISAFLTIGFLLVIAVGFPGMELH